MKVKLKINPELEEKVKSLAEKEGTTVEDFILKIVSEYVNQHWSDDSSFSAEEEEKVKERLRSLGYLD